MRRYFFDNVNSILKRGFEEDVDEALERIALGYSYLFKQALLHHNSGGLLHIIDYEKLVDQCKQKSEICQMCKFLNLSEDLLLPYIELIRKPTVADALVQRR
jgi:hypothetical protein